MTPKKTKYQKNHRTLYVGLDEWESIQSESKRQGRSVSNYLVNLHRARPFKELAPDSSAFRDDSTEVNYGTTAEPIPMKKIKIPEGFVDPLQQAASDLEDLTEEKITVKDKRIFTGKKPKKNSKQASGCPECRAPAGHRAGCLLGGA